MTEAPANPAIHALSPAVLDELRSAVAPGSLLTETAELRTYECDAAVVMRSVPSAVVLPRSAAEVQAVVRTCARHGIPFVARGAGTGLSGGSMPAPGSVVIGLNRMNRILDVDLENGTMRVEPGAINAHITARAAAAGLFFAPDPSSQSVCTIGGNVAENAGGAHCLKYGFTTNHVIGCDVVLPTGELVELGAGVPDAPGYDLLGVFVGSEGTLGIATAVTVRLTRRAESTTVLLAAFPTVRAAAETVSAIIAAAILPAAMEIMDRLAIEAAEAAVHPGYPACAALLLVEVDGPAAEVALHMAAVRELCHAHGATQDRLAQTERERTLIWKGRKATFAAAGRMAPNYIVQDGVIPRTRLPEALDGIAVLAAAAGLRVSNVFHAGDGNLHPIVLYDAAVPGQEAAALALAMRILELCVDLGGSITGEHGVGREKQQSMGYMYAEPDIATMLRVREAFDPAGLSNPDKLFPRPRLCAEKTGIYTPHPLETAGVAVYF